jgi:hypothetical protein
MAADGGTLFLDEINSASPTMQVKLLRVLQEKSFEPVGSSQTKTVDVRVILATNSDLQQLVAEQKFRQTFTTASMSSTSACRVCASDCRTFRCSPITSFANSPIKPAARSWAFPTPP